MNLSRIRKYTCGGIQKGGGWRKTSATECGDEKNRAQKGKKKLSDNATGMREIYIQQARNG